MTLKEFMRQNQLTIKDITKVTKCTFKRVVVIVDKDAKPSIHERNEIINAIAKFKLNPLPIIFNR